jgi:hypothetical protein
LEYDAAAVGAIAASAAVCSFEDNASRVDAQSAQRQESIVTALEGVKVSVGSGRAKPRKFDDVTRFLPMRKPSLSQFFCISIHRGN